MMKNNILNGFILLFAIAIGYYGYTNLNGLYLSIAMFVSGNFLGIFIMMLRLNSKNSKLSLYKRELEKESVSSDEAVARVKVLESKVKVLEKALENALSK